MNSNIAEQMCDAEQLGRTGGENSLSVDSGGGQRVSNGREQMVPGLGQEG